MKNRTGELGTGNTEKTEALTSSFTSVYTPGSGALAFGPKIQAAANTDPAVSMKEEWGGELLRELTLQGFSP